MTEDEKYMTKAISLASRGKGWVNPNPMVGAVIVKEDKIIARGWHRKFGEPHAERDAFSHCSKQSCKGATLYVTLEPCCHYGKTPPCTEAIIEHGIKRVVVGMVDPNPLVGGKGISILRKAGIEVECGILENKVRLQNKVFLKYITTKKPWLAVKTAMTLDGKTATTTGDSKWITCSLSRKYVHQLRSTYMAVMVGSNTIKMDNPMLNSRLEGNVHQPIRIVVDSKASIEMNSNLVKTASEYRTIIVHTSKADVAKIISLKECGVECLECVEKNSHVDVVDMLMKLGKMGIDSILVEGGATLNFSLFKEKLVDEVFSFIAPKIIGGENAKTPVDGNGFEFMSQAIMLDDMKLRHIGDDFLISGFVKK